MCRLLVIFFLSKSFIEVHVRQHGAIHRYEFPTRLGYHSFTKMLIQWSYHDSVHPEYNHRICKQNLRILKAKSPVQWTIFWEKSNIHVCLLPTNTTDCLQPMDLKVNKLAKYFLNRCFGDWYAEQNTKATGGKWYRVDWPATNQSGLTHDERAGSKVDDGHGTNT